MARFRVLCSNMNCIRGEDMENSGNDQATAKVDNQERRAAMVELLRL